MFAYHIPVPNGIQINEDNPKTDKKRARNAVVIAAAIIAAPHLDGKGDGPKNRAAIAEAMRVVRYIYRNLSSYFPELFR